MANGSEEELYAEKHRNDKTWCKPEGPESIETLKADLKKRLQMEKIAIRWARARFGATRTTEICTWFHFSGLSYMGAANIHNLLVVSGPESDAG